MADLLNVTGTNYTSGSIERGESSVALNTGALRRKYNFGDRVSELSPAQDPFFRFVSMVGKKPTDDPSFKFTEKRHSWHKRYSYMYKYGISALPSVDPDNAGITPAADDEYQFDMFTDYHSNGNKQNIVGKSNDYFRGEPGTQPQFYLEGQLMKIAHWVSASGANGASDGYTVWKVVGVELIAGNLTRVTAKCVKGATLIKFHNANAVTLVGASNTGVGKSAETLEPYRVYAMGTVFDAGTGYPDTWQDQPYSTGYGQTQIFKTSMAMNNTDRATVLKYEGNEWARIWKEKLIEHKWDIEQALLFGAQSSTYRTTQGAVDFVSTYGNAFDLDLATKSQDGFLDDLSALLDPRYNNAGATVFFCNTAVYNWLHKLSGYFANNIGSVQPFAGGTPDTAAGQVNTHTAARADMALAGKKKVFGVDVTTISTIYGDMNVVRNIHMDNTSVKMIGVNMKYAAYRPLVGNGINRDTSVYVGVQTLENSGVDRRVDQIITEAGMEWSCPEAHAIWS